MWADYPLIDSVVNLLELVVITFALLLMVVMFTELFQFILNLFLETIGAWQTRGDE